MKNDFQLVDIQTILFACSFAKYTRLYVMIEIKIHLEADGTRYVYMCSICTMYMHNSIGMSQKMSLSSYFSIDASSFAITKPRGSRVQILCYI